MTELSPAQKAPEFIPYEARKIAAALEAAADQVVPDQGDVWRQELRGDAWIRWEERKLIRSELLAIAAELRGTTTTTEDN